MSLEITAMRRSATGFSSEKMLLIWMSASIYCIPLKSLSALAKDVKRNALALDESGVLDGVEVRHPLVCPLLYAISSFHPDDHITEYSAG